ncbi:Intraflagellar Transport Protein 57 [Thraustotheca clavata]|uniref:deoxyribose-phosphate aldolase n=1 Tax=Thraustotheca clavata TaxID=74557 RepID=A0A1W0A3K6_9STRA|nr:Intraflagellar Transport Protein 57 [Thraustotheca clavata]
MDPNGTQHREADLDPVYPLYLVAFLRFPSYFLKTTSKAHFHLEELMPKKKLAAWDEFEEVESDPSMKMSRMECKHCHSSVSKSVNRLLSHLRSCPKYTGELPAPTEDEIEGEEAKNDPLAVVRRAIDHTMLKADATPDDITQLCKEAYENGFYSVCVNSIYALFARDTLDGLERNRKRQSPRVKVCCVVGFPLGASTSETKAFETDECIRNGAEEIDMVIAVGKLKAGDHAYVLRDICAVVTVCKRNHALCKVILETALLTEAEIEVASNLAISAGADFIKTSTGFSTRGASVLDVRLMAQLAIPHGVQVKASGGIRSLEDAELMMEAGATRLGTSSGVKMIKGTPSSAPSSQRDERMATYTFVLTTIQGTSSVFAWKLRDIRARIHRHEYKDDAAFVADVMLLVRASSDAKAKHKTIICMKDMGIIVPKQSHKKEDVHAHQERTLDPDKVLERSTEALKRCQRSSSTVKSLCTTSTIIKAKKSEANEPCPAPEMPLVALHDVQITMESRIVDAPTLERLAQLRFLAEQELCPHLDKKLVTSLKQLSNESDYSHFKLITMADDGEDVDVTTKEEGNKEVRARDDTAVAIMGNVLEKLRILQYDKELSKKKNFVLYTDTYFALPASNSSAQFKSFLELVVYLMKIAEQEFVVDKYDDPNTSVNKLILALKIMGFTLDFPAAKLKQGYGEAVCSALEFICDKALAVKSFCWTKPKYLKEEYAEEAEVDENLEVDADDDNVAIEEEEELYVDTIRAKTEESELEESTKEIILAAVDPLLWKTELERVGPKLKSKIKEDDGKEWHTHIEQTKKHDAIIQGNLASTSLQLKAITTQLAEVIDRMGAKEKYINNQFDHLRQEYHQVKEKLQAVSDRCKEGTERVNAMTNQHTDITEQLRETKTVMDSKGSKMTDTSPLVQIKAALQTLKLEIKNFELRIGVVGHTLLQSKSKQKPLGKRPGDSKAIDPEYDHSDDDLD